ncbi:hypothetical protein DL98DRAFT_508282 [Cadophora sp. DSE1049]|nr:hypothetical protein DL98DRAFT_508282 [Cadophora sp. DSE1049]
MDDRDEDPWGGGILLWRCYIGPTIEQFQSNSHSSRAVTARFIHPALNTTEQNHLISSQLHSSSITSIKHPSNGIFHTVATKSSSAAPQPHASARVSLLSKVPRLGEHHLKQFTQTPIRTAPPNRWYAAAQAQMTIQTEGDSAVESESRDRVFARKLKISALLLGVPVPTRLTVPFYCNSLNSCTLKPVEEARTEI